MNDRLWPKRLFALDISRGFAALAVVLWHWQHFAFKGSSPPEDFDRTSQPLYAIFKIFYEKGSLGVEYFFLLSGFIFFWLYRSSIENKSTCFGDFWMQRFSRLYPLHCITLLIAALLQSAYFSHNGYPFVYPFNDMYHFFLNVVFASQWGFESGWSFNAPVWSISIEVLLYLIFFIISYLRQGKTFFCLGVSVIAFAITPFIHHYIFKGLSLFFFGGFVFYLTVLLSTRFQNLKAMAYIVTALFWILTIVNFYIFNLSDLILELGIIGKGFLIAFPGHILFPLTVCCLTLIEIDRGQFLKSISWIGDITYSSYLLHFPLQLVFGLSVGYGAMNADFYLHPVYLMVFFSILIPLSYITFIGFERPIQNMIRNQFRHQVNPE